MPDDFLQLSTKDRGEALSFAASKSGRPPHLLEKDIWVVWSLGLLFGRPVGDHLAFKGGTSLSKVFQAIRRFSEDIDLTYDIRQLMPDLVEQKGDALPTTYSQAKKWTRVVREPLPEWVKDEILPVIETALADQSLPATASAKDDNIVIEYKPVTSPSDYVLPRVLLEFGARSTGDPNERHEIVCDAAEFLDGVILPTAKPRVMQAERTFWEKATAVHVFCLGGRLRGERFSRHWYDLASLDKVSIATKAIADRALALAVAEHKGWFFREKGSDREFIDYRAAVSGALQLVPAKDLRSILDEDYGRMVEDGLLLDEAEPFEALMERVAELEARTNASAKGE